MDFSSFLESKLEGQRKYSSPRAGMWEGSLGLTNNRIVSNQLNLAGKRLALQLWGGAQPAPRLP